MKTEPLLKNTSSNPIFKNAMRDYKTYVEHYKSKKLTPMPFDDFLSNYRH